MYWIWALLALFLILTLCLLFVYDRSGSKTLPKIDISEKQTYAAIYVYHNEDELKQYVVDYIDQLKSFGYDIFFVSNGKLPVNRELSKDVYVVERENSGFDWAGWAFALDHWPKLREYDNLLFTNDSYFMFKSAEEFKQMIDKQRMSQRSWGITKSHERGTHIQSYFIEVRKHDYPTFFRHVELCDKGDGKTVQTVINNCEVKSWPHLYEPSAVFDPGPGRNPYLDDIEYMLKQGFPMIKKKTPQELVAHIDTKDFY